MGSSLIADSTKRRKIFDRRAESVLKQARELSVLCDVPACVVIYNPDDAIKPWRIWPESEAELRNVIEFYKGKIGSGSTSTVANGVEADHEWKKIDDLDGKIESRIMEYANNVKNRSKILIDQEPPHPSTAVDQQADNNNNMIINNYENYSKLLDASGDADVTFDGWDDDDENNDLFHIHELLNFSDCDCDCDDDDLVPTLLFQNETESAATCSSASAVGIKRKAAPVRVSSFEELMIPSSQRRKLI